MTAKPLFVFDPYRLDVRERLLLRGMQPVPLAPKLFDLLATLVRNAGRLIQKQDLLDEVWSEVEVEEGSLTRAISSLRQVLGSSPDGGDYIQTVAKRGYRFTAPVRETLVDDVDPLRSTGDNPLPPQLLAGEAVEFVGREVELLQMNEVWRRAKAGRYQLLLVAGDPGIGKTRLALEFARARSAEGTTILIGSSDEEVLVPYQPFVECLSWYIRLCDESDLRAQLAAAGGGAELGAFIPELRRRVPDLPSPPFMNPESQRYRLFETVAALLATASRMRPMLLVLDDLHWADKATLLLLRHVMRSARVAPLAIIATYRESELGRSHPLADMLITLRREHNVTHLSLRGFDVTTMEALVAHIVGTEAPPQLAQLVADITEGNAFFATEMLRHLKEDGAIGRLAGLTGKVFEVSRLGLSEGIKEMVGRRLSRLSDTCNRVLSVAAVIGREFEVAVLQEVAGVTVDELVDALEEASRVQLVSESLKAGHFAFMHALVRETLHDELSSPRRVRLHGRVAEAIERVTEDRPVLPLADLAYHFTQAASAGSVDKAIDYAIRAGDRAADALAHEEATRLFGMALMSLEFKPPTADADRLHVNLHTRRARSLDALGEWALEARELEAALRHLDPLQIERRCEIVLQLASAWFLLLDLRPVEQYAAEARQLAERLNRPDLEANAIAWLARCQQANGDLEAAIAMDRRAMARAPGVITAAHMMGPLTLYLAGRSSEGLALACETADAARSSRDSMFIMYSLSHLGLNLTAAGRYAEATTAFNEARSFGRKYGALPMLARVTAMAAGLHLNVFDFRGAEALQSEARDLARSVGFAPPIVSANIDALLAFARSHDPGRAEQLLEETAAAAASTAGWHEWLWRLRLTQARAELALARGAFDEAIATATEAIDQSRTRGRPKYEALGLIVRARGLHAIARSHNAIADARCAVDVAETTGDPALLLIALDVLLELDGSDELAGQARTVTDRVHDALPDEGMRDDFRGSEVVRRIRRRG